MYYVNILHVSENVFWNAEIGFLKGIAINKMAYEEWVSYVREKELNRK